MRLRWLLLLAACTPTPAPPPCATTCAGCCDVQGVCRAGTRDDACGSSATTCGACGATQQCVSRACVDRPTGCAATCSGCCDDGGVCRGGRAQGECGVGGLACAACPTGTLCSAGACITVTQCDSACGVSCCAGAACAGSPCGVDAGACATCAAGLLCAAAACDAGVSSRWRVRVLSATVAPLRPNGDPWDDKNDPDPMACVAVGDAGQRCSLETSDTFTPVWGLALGTYAFEELEHVELSVIDVDFPGQTVIEELGQVDLRPRWSGAPQQWSIGGASVTQLRIDVEPAP